MSAAGYHLHGHSVGRLVKVVAGTTDAVANTVELLAHGLTDAGGSAIDPTKYRVLAIIDNNSEAFPLYLGNGATSSYIDATNIDIRSGGTAVPYIAFIFYTDGID